MRGMTYSWRMAGRRKASCLLVLLFTAVVTVFLLTYPRLIENTQVRLEEAYDSLTVTGWMVNTVDFEDPSIPGADWHTLLDSGYFSSHASYSVFFVGYYEKAVLDAAAGAEPDDHSRLLALQVLTEEAEVQRSSEEYARSGRALNCLEACDDLVRMSESIRWAEGYGPDCLEGEARVCLLPQSAGYEPGDIIPMVAAQSSTYRLLGGIIRLTVAGVYPTNVPEFECVVPLGTFEALCADTGWTFQLRGFTFHVADNRQLPQIKALLMELGYDGTGDSGVRVAVDDRILEGTVSPIRSNLSMLQGLYVFFFLVVIVIGFFLCFLLARGRKPEYAVMRMLGESTAQVTVKALLEQLVLCLLGICLGAALLMIAGQGSPAAATCGMILACYTLGAAAAVLLTVRVNVMEILRDKE